VTTWGFEGWTTGPATEGVPSTRCCGGCSEALALAAAAAAAAAAAEEDGMAVMGLAGVAEATGEAAARVEALGPGSATATTTTRCCGITR